MKVDQHKKRLRAIKLKYRLFSTKCECCQEEYYREKMWRVFRYGVNERAIEYNYCLRCMKTAEDVLDEIDTDEIDWGIWGIDSFLGFKKRDSTRLKAHLESIFPAK